jgi:DNA mismatch endonuclease, patch repair protein
VRFWKEKLQRNVARDIAVRCQLDALGWRVFELWSCEVRDQKMLAQVIAKIKSVG